LVLTAEQCKYFKADVTQPDEARGLVEKAATAMHFTFSTPNFLIQEAMLTDVPWRWDVMQHSHGTPQRLLAGASKFRAWHQRE
jgi:hypothetical protein